MSRNDGCWFFGIDPSSPCFGPVEARRTGGDKDGYQLTDLCKHHFLVQSSKTPMPWVRPEIPPKTKAETPPKRNSPSPTEYKVVEEVDKVARAISRLRSLSPGDRIKVLNSFCHFCGDERQSGQRCKCGRR